MRKTCEAQIAAATLDVVVPFTTPALTRAALKAVDRIGAGLNASIRLLKVQIVPYPLDIAQSPIPLLFLEEQLMACRSKLPVSCEVRLAREFEPGLRGVLNEDTLVILAMNKRPWRTRTERLAASLRRSGCNVILVREGNPNNA